MRPITMLMLGSLFSGIIAGAATEHQPEEQAMSDNAEQERYLRPSQAELKARLSPIAYRVTQKDGTEPAYDNPYWNEKRDGLYVDVVTGEPLFSSADKYDSGTGWPSFTRPVSDDAVVTRRDFKLLLPRTEVRSRHGDSHLGHVFKDGPAPTGLRYCMNSAALRFIPAEQLAAEGYASYGDQFGVEDVR